MDGAATATELIALRAGTICLEYPEYPKPRSFPLLAVGMVLVVLERVVGPAGRATAGIRVFL